ncbi:hypothetical protein RJT34_17363 [Clitoria ternatea]|uniref:Protein kinase domain-containing protein n=1 Tax=Clitoria ternatea TaxID=43366 RepID=A0AAN9JBY7_CLITE
MAIAPAIPHPTLIIIVIIIINVHVINSMSESEALLSFKSSFSNAKTLVTWVAGSVPCTEDDQWEGIICFNGFVTGLRLEGMRLLGENINVDALLELKGLRTISIANNNFSGSIPKFNKIGFLKTLYLSGNKFSGDIPHEYFQGMRSLKKLWLSNNEFTGLVPSSLAQVPHLMELHLENNQFSGGLPSLDNPSLMRFNVSNNKLEGEVPVSMLRFGESAFAGNPGLCGDKFRKTCGKPREGPSPAPADDQNNVDDDNVIVPDRSGSSTLQIAGIVLTSVLLVSLVVFMVVRARRKKDEDLGIVGEEGSDEGAVKVQVTGPVRRNLDAGTSMRKTSSASSSRKLSSSHQGKSVGELVMVNDEKGVFGLPDLMRAAAEVLGNGGFGSSYKAVMVNGVAVVVKRTREISALGKEEFDAEMRKIGKLKHWNILTPLAYHYRKDEKLIISEYVPRGSLLFLLHGDRGPSHADLDWPARLKIVRGIAEGMRYLHTELASSNLPHGNLKSSNVLLGPDYEPMLVDHGFSHMIHPSSVAQSQFAYKAPEAAQHCQISQKCDVYCFGVVILEILTGKFPSQYLSNGKGGTDVVQWVANAISEGRELELLDPEIASSRKNSVHEMEQLLHIGAACTESNPEHRLDMMEAIRRIEKIQCEGVHQESIRIEGLPPLRDGYANSQVGDSQGHADQSPRRHGTNSFGSRDNFEIGPS